MFQETLEHLYNLIEKNIYVNFKYYLLFYLG